MLLGFSPDVGDLEAGVLQAIKDEGQRWRDDQRGYLQEHTVNIESLLTQQSARLQKSLEDLISQRPASTTPPTPFNPTPSLPPQRAPAPPKSGGAPMLSLGLPGEMQSEGISLQARLQGADQPPPVLSVPTSGRPSVKKALSLQLPDSMPKQRSSRNQVRSFFDDSVEPVLPNFDAVTPIDSRRISCLSQRSATFGGGSTVPQTVGDRDDEDDDDDDIECVDVNAVVNFSNCPDIGGSGGARASVQSMDSMDKAEMQAEWNDMVKRDIADTLQNTKSRSVVGGSASLGDSENCVLKVVTHNAFASICACVVVSNAAFIGLDASVSMSLALDDKPQPAYFRPVHSCFAVFFLVELSFRIWAYKWHFIYGFDWKWNLFDTALVISSIFEEILESMAPVGFLRVVRGLRMIRVLRLLRIFSLIRDLRLMVCSLMQSFSSLFWALMLLVVITYLAAVFFIQGSLIHMSSTVPGSAFRTEIQTWYRTLPRAFVTVTMSVTGGMDWVDAVRPLSRIHWFYECAFILYIFVVVIGVLNVLTGIFVERAQELSGLDPDLIIQGELKRNKAFLAQMKGFFEEADADKSGMISWEEFKEYVRRQDIQAYLATQQLDAHDARQLWSILNLDDNTEVNIDDFIFGCMRLKGSAKSVDVVALLQENRKHQKRMKDAICCLEEQLMAIASTVGATQIENSTLSRRTSFAHGRSVSASRRTSHLNGG